MANISEIIADRGCCDKAFLKNSRAINEINLRHDGESVVIRKSSVVIASLIALPLAMFELVTTQAIGQEEKASAFIDPFNPGKSGSGASAKESGKSNSIFPKFSMPKMPKIPNLNPFSKKAPSAPKKVAPKKPGMLQQINNGTRNFFSKTTQTLMPWTKPKPQPNQGAIIPAFMKNERTAEKKKSGIQLMNFFQPSESKKDVKTTEDFFRRERPGFRK